MWPPSLLCRLLAKPTEYVMVRLALGLRSKARNLNLKQALP